MFIFLQILGIEKNQNAIKQLCFGGPCLTVSCLSYVPYVIFPAAVLSQLTVPLVNSA